MAAGDQRTLRDAGPAGDARVLVSTVAQKQGRAVLIDCTASGTITLVFPTGNSIILHLPAAGVYEFNWAIVSFTQGAGTYTVYNLD